MYKKILVKERGFSFMNNKTLLIATLVTSAVTLVVTVIFGFRKPKCRWRAEELVLFDEIFEESCGDENK